MHILLIWYLFGRQRARKMSKSFRTKDSNPDRQSPVQLPRDLMPPYQHILFSPCPWYGAAFSSCHNVLWNNADSWWIVKGQVELVKKKTKRKAIPCSHSPLWVLLVSSWRYSSCRLSARLTKKTEKKRENSLEIVRCNGPKQGNRNTTEERWWPPLLKLICRLFQGWVIQGEGQDVK